DRSWRRFAQRSSTRALDRRGASLSKWPGMHDKTRLIRAGAAPDPLAKTVGPPIQRGSTVLLPNAEALYDHEQYVTYGRQGLAAQAALQDALAAMEHAVGVALYPSGLAALTGALLAVLKAGDEVLVVDYVYAPTRRFCVQVLRRYGVGVGYFDPRQAPEALVEGASPATRLILMESPGSLTLEMQDVARIAQLATRRGILTACDNTWGAGLLYKPLRHGVDLSIQALTKYVGGHSDLFMGSAAARDPALVRALNDGVLHLGWAVSPEDAYFMLRGLRTLPTRLERQGQSALGIADWLGSQPEVAAIYYPALPGAPDHELWKRDFSGAASLFAFALKPGPEAAVNAFLDALQLFGLGFSWGGFESLAIACDPQLKSRRFRRDYGGPLIRLHIGLEDPDDLIDDLRRALAVYSQGVL
ncbi:MAG: cystathionine beta-lyase, partial [Phenylobacterium sp.]|nr:cystathionine beta-lyase [Phenylobacterium sp.]